MLVAAAQGARSAAAALRWFAAGAIAFAGLLLVSLSLAAFERGGAEEPAEVSASAYLDFDLSVLRTLADRSLRAGDEGERRALLQLWARRPAWQVPRAQPASAQLVPLREAWAAVVSDRSHFRTAARGAAAALPFVLGGLVLTFLAAAIASVLARLRLAGAAGRLAFGAGVYLLVAHPLWALLDPTVFYDRTRSLGLAFSAVLFVAAFAGTVSGAAARALFAEAPHAAHLGALGGDRALLAGARLAALEAADRLLPLVPALVAAALFVCAKADQDPSLSTTANGLGALVRSAMQEQSVPQRLSSCALVTAALVLLWFLGHRFVLEVRAALGASRVSP